MQTAESGSDAPNLVESAREVNQSPRPNIMFVEGMRGFAALSVLLYHAYNATKKDPNFSISPAHHHLQAFIFMHVFGLFNYGGEGVEVFIVISGFCLMLPVACSLNGQLSGGWLGFFKRRARRILPPYYVALIISLLLYVGLGAARHHIKILSHITVPSVTAGQIISHLFLFENLIPAWRFTIDGPMWSVAAESQIYIFFPFVLIPVWRRFGNCAAVAAALVIGMAPYLFHPLYYSHLIVLFSFGMLAAVFSFPKSSADAAFANRVPWAPVTLALLAAVVLNNEFKPVWLAAFGRSDMLVGLMVACFLVWSVRSDGRRFATPLMLFTKLFKSKPALMVGAFSYSLYLVHHPIVMVLSQIIRRFHLGEAASFLTIVACALPLSLGAAYLFYIAIERPFISKSARQRIANEVKSTSLRKSQY